MIWPTGRRLRAMIWVAGALAVMGVGVAWWQRDEVELATEADEAAAGDVVREPAFDSYDVREPSMGSEGVRAESPNPSGSTTAQGPCFRYTVPAGWRVVEDGQFAVVLMAPDERAITTMVGNVGLPTNYNPAQYVSDKLSQTGLGNLRFGQARPAQPVFGFPSAWEFDVDYVVGGIVCRGVAKCSVAPNYDFCTMVMTWAASEASQWPRYASWLPQVAGQVEVTNSAAFGASGIAQQNLQNSIALGEQARRNREHSQQQWADVTRQRGDSQDRNNADFREALDGVKRYDNPYDNRPIDLPSSNTVYWVNPVTGQIVGDPNPSFDPRTATDSNWQPLKPVR